jgi:hypothetical protein
LEILLRLLLITSVAGFFPGPPRAAALRQDNPGMGHLRNGYLFAETKGEKNMKEAEVRKFHRSLGIIVVWFLAGQTLTGLALSVGSLGGYTGWLTKLAGILHYDWEPLGSLYRLILALGIFAQGVSGIIIYYRIKARASSSQ